MEIDEGILRATNAARDEIFDEVGALERQVQDPTVKITRTLLLESLAKFRAVVEDAAKHAAEKSQERMTEFDGERVEEALKKKKEVEDQMADLGLRYATALRVLEDADVTEWDLVGVENQVNPVQVLRAAQLRKRG
jgi:hypothetical protein